MGKKILLIGTLDTKGEEFGYLKESIESTGLQTMVMDAGVLGKPSFEPDIDRNQVARAGGQDIATLIKQKDRGKSMETMMTGAVSITQRLYDEGKISGIMGMGGGSGTNLACAAMRALPFGFPKLVISTLASGDTEPFIQDKDIMMLFSVADILGLNPIIRKIISKGAAAMAGMVKADLHKKAAGEQQKDSRPLISATMMGTTTDCVTLAKKIIEDKNMEIVAFAASTSGGRAMENLIGEGLVQGVLDITTTEIINTVAGGVFPASSHRFETAGKLGLPQVLACGAIDFVNFWTGHIPDRFKSRKFYQHNPIAVLMRTNQQENMEAGRAMAKKLNSSRGPVAFFIPLKGFSSYDIEGGPFYDPEADQAFIGSLEKNLRPDIKVIKCSCHINEEQFASDMVEALEDMMNK